VRFAGRTIDAAYAALPDTYACFPMLAIQSTSPSDHMTHDPARRIKKLRHLVTARCAPARPSCRLWSPSGSGSRRDPEGRQVSRLQMCEN
jgi:hypothetical protein